MDEINRRWLDIIKMRYDETKNDNTMNQQQKNKQYAYLMTVLESEFSIPLLAGERFDALDPEIKNLYLEISNARIW